MALPSSSGRCPPIANFGNGGICESRAGIGNTAKSAFRLANLATSLASRLYFGSLYNRPPPVPSPSSSNGFLHKQTCFEEVVCTVLFKNYLEVRILYESEIPKINQRRQMLAIGNDELVAIAESRLAGRNHRRYRSSGERVLGLRLFDAAAGALALAQGRIAEMQTGEGKTLAAVRHRMALRNTRAFMS
jgi:hypothetical protein